MFKFFLNSLSNFLNSPLASTTLIFKTPSAILLALLAYSSVMNSPFLIGSIFSCFNISFTFLSDSLVINSTSFSNSFLTLSLYFLVYISPLDVKPGIGSLVSFKALLTISSILSTFSSDILICLLNLDVLTSTLPDSTDMSLVSISGVSSDLTSISILSLPNIKLLACILSLAPSNMFLYSLGRIEFMYAPNEGLTFGFHVLVRLISLSAYPLWNSSKLTNLLPSNPVL